MTTPIHEIEVKVKLPCCSVCKAKMSTVCEGWDNSNSPHSKGADFAVFLPCPRAAQHGQSGLKMSTTYETIVDDNGFITKTIVTLAFSEPETIDRSTDLDNTYRVRRLDFEIRGKRESEENGPTSPIEPYYETFSTTERATNTDSPPPLIAMVQHV